MAAIKMPEGSEGSGMRAFTGEVTWRCKAAIKMPEGS